MSNDPKNVSPDAVLAEVVKNIPAALRSQVVIIGSLAAAYWFAGSGSTLSVRTKDVDVVLTPRSSARNTGEAMAKKLLSSGWRPKEDGDFGAPGGPDTPDDKLPALRLYPPDNNDWFLELLTVPEKQQSARGFMRFALSTGEHYGLPSFQFTSVATFNAERTKFDIHAATPPMMALAHLLEHPVIRPDTIKGTSTKRSNKDLGRVLALAWLSEDASEEWATPWAAALQALFPDTWRDLAVRAGDGLKALLASPADLQQAADSSNNGLLASRNVSAEQLKATGERLLAFTIAELVKLARG